MLLEAVHYMEDAWGCKEEEKIDKQIFFLIFRFRLLA